MYLNFPEKKNVETKLYGSSRLFQIVGKKAFHDM